MSSRKYNAYLEDAYQEHVESGGDDVPIPDDRVYSVTDEEVTSYFKYLEDKYGTDMKYEEEAETARDRKYVLAAVAAGFTDEQWATFFRDVGPYDITVPNPELVKFVDAIGDHSWQNRVKPWLIACFGEEIASDVVERNHRFLEESLELVQACGCTSDEAHQLVDYVYGRPTGEKRQEVGGVMTTLASLCLAQGMNLQECADTELARVWRSIEKIRAKQAAKPKSSPLAE